MPRTRRRIESLSCYEVCFRARKTLPLVAYRIIDMIIHHALSRAQRDKKVFLCHDLWNGSHPHIIILTKDSAQCMNFYTEVQKKITDCLKRLLGLDHLSIWEGRPMVARIGDIDEAIKRISYLYANPAQDNLESSIERFPGYSSYKEFLLAKDKPVTFQASTEVLRLRLPTIPVLPTRTPDALQEKRAIRLLEKRNEETQLLVRHPNIWMKSFNLREQDVPEINERIMKKIRHRERIAALLRRITGKPLLGQAKLRRQPILKPHKPKKKQRKILYLGSCRENRMWFIQEFKEFCRQCRECYKEWLRGNFLVKWPPGAFKPPMPPNVNILPIL